MPKRAKRQKHNPRIDDFARFVNFKYGLEKVDFIHGKKRGLVFNVLRPPERTTRTLPVGRVKVCQHASLPRHKEPDEDEQGDEDSRDDGNHLIDHGGNSRRNKRGVERRGGILGEAAGRGHRRGRAQ